MSVIRGSDLENEALAAFALGRLFDKVLKMHDRARACYVLVLQLAEAMKPRFVSRETWYTESFQRLHQLQQTSTRALDEADLLETEEFARELASELEAIGKARARSGQELIEHLYSTHPPRVKGTEVKKPENVTAETLKRSILLVISHYHPDKNRGGMDDEDEEKSRENRKWHFLCTEIVK
ncbi:hypothetical protein HK102_003418, partial [Quaeritorhiza haematococci]